MLIKSNCPNFPEMLKVVDDQSFISLSEERITKEKVRSILDKLNTENKRKAIQRQIYNMAVEHLQELSKMHWPFTFKVAELPGSTIFYYNHRGYDKVKALEFGDYIDNLWSLDKNTLKSMYAQFIKERNSVPFILSFLDTIRVRGMESNPVFYQITFNKKTDSFLFEQLTELKY